LNSEGALSEKILLLAKFHLNFSFINTAISGSKAAIEVFQGSQRTLHFEPHRVCRRPFRLSYAATAGASSMA
jgi:hypothetical protein